MFQCDSCTDFSAKDDYYYVIHGILPKLNK